MRSIAKTPPDSRPALLGWSLALGALSVLVAQGVVAPLDRQIAGWMATLRSPMLDGPMRTLTWFGGSTWTLLGLSGLSALARRRGGWAAVRMLWLAFLLGAVMEVALRLSVGQWRPDTTALPPAMDAVTRFELAGFPSGHAFRSAFVFGWLAVEARGWPRAGWWRAMCLVMTALVGCTRVYLNRHWATDVVGAWLVVLVTLAASQRR
jgi:undecaprenyl-diphosphatase